MQSVLANKQKLPFDELGLLLCDKAQTHPADHGYTAPHNQPSQCYRHQVGPDHNSEL
jgi:hypothetical protein